VKLLDFGLSAAALEAIYSASTPRTADRPLDVRVDIQAVGSVLYEMLTGRSGVRQGGSARAHGGGGQREETAEALVPAIPAGLARIVDQALAANSSLGIASAKEMASQLAPFAVSERPPSLAPRNTLMPFLSPEARRSRGMARLERAVLGLPEPKEKGSVRPNLVLIEGAQGEKAARHGESANKIQPTDSSRHLQPEDLLEPRIPRPPRTPKHIVSNLPRFSHADRHELGGRWRKRSRASLPLRRWRASQPTGSPDDRTSPPTGSNRVMNPMIMRIWSAGLLAAAGLGAGLLLARLLHL
jgi:serine/threonine protein kinase